MNEPTLKVTKFRSILKPAWWRHPLLWWKMRRFHREADRLFDGPGEGTLTTQARAELDRQIEEQLIFGRTDR